MTFYLICKWRKAVTENGRSVSSLHRVAGHLLVFSAFQHLLEPASPAVTMHLLLFPGKFLCPLNTHRHCYNSGLLVQPDPGPFSMNSNMKLFASDSLFLCLSPLPYSYSPLFTLIWPPGINCPHSLSQGEKNISANGPQILIPEFQVMEDYISIKR